MFVYALYLIISVAQAKTIEQFWTISNFTQNLDGVERMALGVNGKPGYMTSINAERGDRLIIHFTNHLNLPTSLHMHGLFQNGTGFMDGPAGMTQCPVAPGHTFTYDMMLEDVVGTYFWHAHTKLHLMDGLRGPLIITDPEEDGEVIQDQVIMMTDWYHEQSDNILTAFQNKDTNPEGILPIWSSGLINGMGQFDCKYATSVCTEKQKWIFQNVEPSSTVRLRLINTSGLAAFFFSIDGHKLTVVEADGIRMDPYEVDALTINIAQRYSVLVTMNQQPGNYLIRANMYIGTPWTNTPSMPPGMNPNVTAILNYAGVESNVSPNIPFAMEKLVILDDNQLTPERPSQPPPVGPNDLVLLYEFAFKTLPGDTYKKAYATVSKLVPSLEANPADNINSTTTIAPNGLAWDQMFSGSFKSNSSNPVLHQAHSQGAVWKPAKSLNAIFLTKGQVVDIVVRNDGTMEHPFHLHGHVVWVMATGQAKSVADVPTVYKNQNPLRRDVVTIPPCPKGEDGKCLEASVRGGESAGIKNPFPQAVEGTWFGYSVLRFVADNPGTWSFHCHIEWHIASGLVVTFVESIPDIQLLNRSTVSDDTCSSFNDMKTWKQEKKGIIRETKKSDTFIGWREHWPPCSKRCEDGAGSAETGLARLVFLVLKEEESIDISLCSDGARLLAGVLWLKGRGLANKETGVDGAMTVKEATEDGIDGDVWNKLGSVGLG
ncbi:Cupredoxin [Chytriomyces sp. MP71]|nr:Cupredoxin [Chytriomyces sp. MP71]